MLASVEVGNYTKFDSKVRARNFWIAWFYICSDYEDYRNRIRTLKQSV